jgi:putative ABC transport system substrate-binding protein
MKRRQFITLLGGAAVAWPLAARAQQPASKRPLIGFLGAASKISGGRYYGGFALGMRDLGYVEGRDYLFDDHYADGEVTHLPLLADEMVRLKPDVIVSSNTAAAVATKRVTDSIPIVCANLTDPVGAGLVASESRPGTNVTGILSDLRGEHRNEVSRGSTSVIRRMLSNGERPNLLRRRWASAWRRPKLLALIT